jgi:DNA-directed RNA polymerase subunit H (RpoH/RPB5)
MSVSIEYSSKEIAQIILENTLKMLVNRKVFPSYESIKKTVDELLDDFITKNIVEITDNNKKKISINLFSGKLASIVQGSTLNEYLRSNLDVHKIVIMKESTKKTVKQITTDYPNAEFFFEHELMEDKSVKLFIPKHILLNETDKTEILKNFKETEFKIIKDTDMMIRYYYGRPGDIFKIIRPSMSAGNNIDYRRVVSGTWDIYFGN